MQQVDEKTLYFRKILGETIKELRENKNKLSRNKIAGEYSLNDSNLGKIERADIDCKFVTLWKIVEALNIDFKDFILILQSKLGKDFKFMDE